MTAVAGILNKQGVAIAADSAVTVSGPDKKKVYNSANKIFTLSKYHPVGVAIYSSSTFMGIPWEILIKEYRKQLGKKSFAKLEQYRDDFFFWLKKNEYFCDNKADEHLFQELMGFIQQIVGACNKRIAPKNIEEADLIKTLEFFAKKIAPRNQKIDSLSTLTKEKLHEILEPYLDQLIEILVSNLGAKFQKKNISKGLMDGFFEYLTRNQFMHYTGLIFTGYGEKELFPKLLPVNVSLVVDGKLRHYLDKDREAEVSNKMGAAIRPFAQTDVIDTILQGVSPELNNLSSSVFEDFISSLVKEICKIDNMPNEVIKKLSGLDIGTYVEEYRNTFGKIIRERYVDPLMNAVAQLSKEDLYEMAESLVYLTYLKRRFTMAEESVGGPVDIAVITKGDGFVWIKRKHYFDKELNPGFIQKYY